MHVAHNYIHNYMLSIVMGAWQFYVNIFLHVCVCGYNTYIATYNSYVHTVIATYTYWYVHMYIIILKLNNSTTKARFSDAEYIDDTYLYGAVAKGIIFPPL